MLGKLTTMEFALGVPDPGKPFPVPRNAWNLAHYAGGSSSGCGSGVASGMVLGALGSDTAGSIRMPAGFNGVTGLNRSRANLRLLRPRPRRSAGAHRTGLRAAAVSAGRAPSSRLVCGGDPAGRLSGRPHAARRLRPHDQPFSPPPHRQRQRERPALLGKPHREHEHRVARGFQYAVCSDVITLVGSRPVTSASGGAPRCPIGVATRSAVSSSASIFACATRRTRMACW
ncbi:amidase family protein [Amycolatopsis echigonensis]